MSRGLWDFFVTVLGGESVALLGPRFSGKTTLHRYLLETGETGEIEPTLGREKTTWNRNKAIGLSIRRGTDFPGGEANYRDWRLQFDKSRRIFYLFDAHRTRTVEAYRELVYREGKMLKEWDVGNKHVMMLGTHADQDPKAAEIGPAAYQDLIADLDVITMFQTRAKVKGLAVGSMRTDDEALSMVKRAMGSS